MEINPEIYKHLKGNKIGEKEGLAYLLSVYFDVIPCYIPEVLIRLIYISKIIEPDKTGVKWNIPLFQGQETKFEWVKTEYVKLFKDKNSDKGGHVREATARMKRLFIENPEYRKEDIIEATKLYLNSLNDVRYIMLPHYFIEKGKGVEKTQEILTWLEKLEELREFNQQAGQSLNTKMQ